MKPLYLIFAFLSAILAYHINVKAGSIFPIGWAFVDFFLWPFAWIKWIICEQVNISIIKEAFHWFFR